MEIYSFIHTEDLLQMWRSLYNMQPNIIAVAAATKLTKKNENFLTIYKFNIMAPF